LASAEALAAIEIRHTSELEYAAAQVSSLNEETIHLRVSLERLEVAALEAERRATRSQAESETNAAESKKMALKLEDVQERLRSAVALQQSTETEAASKIIALQGELEILQRVHFEIVRDQEHVKMVILK
jgi:hypothetical protein